MPYRMYLSIYVGQIKSRLCDPVPCKIYLTKHYHNYRFKDVYNGGTVKTWSDICHIY